MNVSVRRAGTMLLALILVAAVTLLGSTSVSHAQSTCTKLSTVNMMNLANTPNTIVINSYTEDGPVGSPLQDTLEANATKVYFDIPGGPGFQGSVVVSAAQGLAAIANISCVGFSAGGSYIALSSGAPSVKLPLLFSNNSTFYTTFSVQNTGSNDADVTVEYSDGTSQPAATIKSNSAKVYDQRNEQHNQAIFAGKATSTNGEPIVAAALQENEGSSIIFAYTGFSSEGSLFPVFPLVNTNNSDYTTGIQIQNSGSVATDVTVSYVPSQAGTACTETQTIQPGASNTFALAVFVAGDLTGITSDCTQGEKFIGAASVETNSASQNLVGLVNQFNPVKSVGEAYSGFAVEDATSELLMPLLMDRNSDYWTSFNIQNVGSASTEVTCKVFNSSDASGNPVVDYEVSQNLAPGEALTNLQFGQIAPGYIGSGTCTAADANGKIVGVVNQLDSTNRSGDQLYTYEAISR